MNTCFTLQNRLIAKLFACQVLLSFRGMNLKQEGLFVHLSVYFIRVLPPPQG